MELGTYFVKTMNGKKYPYRVTGVSLRGTLIMRLTNELESTVNNAYLEKNVDTNLEAVKNVLKIELQSNHLHQSTRTSFLLHIDNINRLEK